MNAKDKITEMLKIADIRIDGDRDQDIKIVDERVFDRCIAQSTLGLGESYMDGWWTSNALDKTMYQLVDNRKEIMKLLTWNLPHLKLLLLSRFINRQSKRRAFTVGQVHYDIGNDLYEKMLDSNMQYSCGYWMKGADDLEKAQQDKLELIARKLNLKPGMRVLDIGCGWGGLAAYLAKNHAVNVVGLTISKEQLKYAKHRFSDLTVDYLLYDYRDYRGEPFDRIVSVGMFEHVGYKNYRVYMQCINQLLKEDGICLIHTIGDTVTDTVTDPWLDKYIFPNGMLPSVRHIANAIIEPMVVEDWHNFGANYDRTLMAWYERFVNAWPGLKATGKYDDRFFRMWEYYLLSCAANFRSRRRAQLWQIVISKTGVKGGYVSAR